MPQVDPDDDTIRRYVVHHYRYDEERHERRNVLVAAYDSAGEWHAALEGLQGELERRRASGEPVDPRENVSGTEWKPGDRGRAAYGHQLRRAMEHGVLPADLDETRLPQNMAIMRSTDRPRRGPLGRLIRSVKARRR